MTSKLTVKVYTEDYTTYSSMLEKYKKEGYTIKERGIDSQGIRHFIGVKEDAKEETKLDFSKVLEDISNIEEDKE